MHLIRHQVNVAVKEPGIRKEGKSASRRPSDGRRHHDVACPRNSELIFVETHSEGCVSLLRDHLREHGERICGPDFIFRQDSTLFVHTTPKVVERLPEQAIIDYSQGVAFGFGFAFESFFEGGKQHRNISGLRRALATRMECLRPNMIDQLYNGQTMINLLYD